jgi:hypothetical protein
MKYLQIFLQGYLAHWFFNVPRMCVIANIIALVANSINYTSKFVGILPRGEKLQFFLFSI